MKIKYLILCFVASLLASCGEIDESNLKLYPSKLYLGVSGYNLQEIYDLGEESLVWDVYVDKSGYYDNAAEVELSYDPTVLTDYQELTQEGLDFEVLPEHVGTLGQKRLSLAADATLGGTQLTFDMTTLRTLIPKDEEVKYVYPVRIKSLTEGVEVNADKDYLLLAIRLNTPQANLRGKGSLIEADCDPWRGTNMDKIIVPLIMDLPFDNESMELTFDYEADPALLDSYNQLYGTNYELLPECYTTPELKIKAGEVSGTAEMEVDPVQLAGETGYDLEGKSYMLPIRITGCDNPSVKIQAGAVTYVKVATKAKWTGTWTETILEGESGISTTAGSVLSVKLYTRHAVIANAVGDENCQNMMSGWILDDEAILCPGWSGTMFEQCSPIIKITEEDYDNSGKKKVDVLAGWFGDIWNWGGKPVSANNSWYDPNSQVLHLEWSGGYSWGDYTIKREFSNPIFD